MKNQKSSWCGVQCLHFQKKKKNKIKKKRKIQKEKERYDIKLRRSQVMLYVDQCGRAKQNSNDIITN